MGGQAFKNHLEDSFDDKLITIISDSQHIEEALKKGEELFGQMFSGQCTDGIPTDMLSEHITDVWNEYWSKYYVR
jgi:hypothetical protein